MVEPITMENPLLLNRKPTVLNLLTKTSTDLKGLKNESLGNCVANYMVFLNNRVQTQPMICMNNGSDIQGRGREIKIQSQILLPPPAPTDHWHTFQRSFSYRGGGGGGEDH